MPLEGWGPAPFTEPDGLELFPPPASVCWDEASNVNHIGPGSYYRGLGDKLWDCCGVKARFACPLSRKKPHATLGENTEAHAAQCPCFLDEEMNEQGLIGQVLLGKSRPSSQHRQNLSPDFLVSRPLLLFGSATRRQWKASGSKFLFPFGWEKGDRILKNRLPRESGWEQHWLQ